MTDQPITDLAAATSGPLLMDHCRAFARWIKLSGTAEEAIDPEPAVDAPGAAPDPAPALPVRTAKVGEAVVRELLGLVRGHPAVPARHAFALGPGGAAPGPAERRAGLVQLHGAVRHPGPAPGGNLGVLLLGRGRGQAPGGHHLPGRCSRGVRAAASAPR